jgi:hypothetical protein
MTATDTRPAAATLTTAALRPARAADTFRALVARVLAFTRPKVRPDRIVAARARREAARRAADSLLR